MREVTHLNKSDIHRKAEPFRRLMAARMRAPLSAVSKSFVGLLRPFSLAEVIRENVEMIVGSDVDSSQSTVALTGISQQVRVDGVSKGQSVSRAASFWQQEDKMVELISHVLRKKREKKITFHSVAKALSMCFGEALAKAEEILASNIWSYILLK